ncbi:MAG: ATP-binding protein [Cyclobacteriaceae bacterium]
MSKVKIAIIGPESSGKTTLAHELALHYKCGFVEEHARSYLKSINRHYTFDDILEICRKQKEMEELAFRQTDSILICDSTALTCQIWCEDKFQIANPEIDLQVKKDSYEMILLCKPDIEWEPDPQREDENRRDHLFDVYQNKLLELGREFKVIEGIGNKRTKMAIMFVDQMLAEM